MGDGSVKLQREADRSGPSMRIPRAKPDCKTDRKRSCESVRLSESRRRTTVGKG